MLRIKLMSDDGKGITTPEALAAEAKGRRHGRRVHSHRRSRVHAFPALTGPHTKSTPTDGSSPMPTGPLTPDEIQQRTDAAEALGKSGDARGAAHAYDQLGTLIQQRCGRFDPRAIDAYEAMSRWVASPNTAPDQDGSPRK